MNTMLSDNEIESIREVSLMDRKRKIPEILQRCVYTDLLKAVAA